jgi:hypothetical protein
VKTFPFSFGAVAAAIWLSLAAVSYGQLTLPPNPGDVVRRKLGEGGGVTGAGASSVNISPLTPAPRTIVIHYVAVSAMRAWTNAEGKTMTARLLAFSAPKEGQAGPVEVIRDGKVRFLLEQGKTPVDYPLASLSQPDQIDIKAIAQAAKREAPANPPAAAPAPAGPKP